MKDLVNHNVLDISPYKPGKPIEDVKRMYGLDRVIKLASNENPFPIPDIVWRRLEEHRSELHTYPDNDSYYLRQKIAENNNIKMENVIFGAGTVELIRMIGRLFLRPGDTVLTSERTFLLYRIAALENLGRQAYCEVPLDEQYRFNLPGMLDAIDESTKIIYVANPNNPTGTILGKAELLDFIDRVPERIIVVLDNAYQEYVSNPDDYLEGVDLALDRPNVIVLRTFSKIYGLAGFRVGYGITKEETAALLYRVKAPFNVTRTGQIAALAALDDLEYPRRSASLNFKNRAKLYQQMKDLGVNVIMSETNFLFFIPEMDVLELYEKMLKRGVIIRPLHAYGAPEALRVTVGFEEDNDFFVSQLAEVLSK